MCAWCISLGAVIKFHLIQFDKNIRAFYTRGISWYVIMQNTVCRRGCKQLYNAAKLRTLANNDVVSNSSAHAVNYTIPLRSTLTIPAHHIYQLCNSEAKPRDSLNLWNQLLLINAFYDFCAREKQRCSISLCFIRCFIYLA